MIAYVTLGADDLVAAKAFYMSFLPALGYVLEESEEGLAFALPQQSPQDYAPPELYVKPTFDGQPASFGNGTMLAFDAVNQAQVRSLHAAAMAAGRGTPSSRRSPGRMASSRRRGGGNGIGRDARRRATW